MAARRAALDPNEEGYTPSDAEKEADAAALRTLTSKTGAVEVDLDEDEEEPEEEEPQRPTRREKKRERKRLIDQNEELREREARARETAAQALGYAQALQQRGPAAPQADPWEEERKSLQAEQDLLVREFELKKANLTSADAEDFKKRAWAFEEKKAAYHARRSQPQQQNPGADPSLQLMARYPDVMSDERARAWAFSRYSQRQIETNRNDWALRDEVVEEARERFGMAPKRRDDREPAMRRKLSGTPKGGSGAGGERPGRIELTPGQVKEADAAYPHLPPEKRYKHFAKVITRE